MDIITDRQMETNGSNELFDEKIKMENDYGDRSETVYGGEY